MQRTFVAITLALALTSAMGAFTPSSYVKAPIVVVQDNETNFTNNADNSFLRLASVTAGDVYITANNLTVNTTAGGSNNNGWNVYFKKLEAKALTTTGSLLSYNFTTGINVFYVNNYAISLSSDKETSNSTNLVVFQIPLTGGAQVPKLTYTNNTNDTAFVPTHLTQQVIGKVVYLFYLSADKTINVTSFTVGGTLSTTKFTLTSNYNVTNSLQVVWGEALGTSKLYAVWREGDVFKTSTVDLSKGNATVANLEGFHPENYTCYAYATDKNWYGDICTTTNTTDADTKLHTRTYYVRTNNVTGLVPLATYNISNSVYNANYPYAQYLVLDLVENVNSTSTSHSYEIWNLDTRTLFRNRTLYLQIDPTTSKVVPFRVVSGGLYSLIYNLPVTTGTAKGPITNIQVGLLLGSSYLVSVFGFLLTIIAGLFLF